GGTKEEFLGLAPFGAGRGSKTCLRRRSETRRRVYRNFPIFIEFGLRLKVKNRLVPVVKNGFASRSEECPAGVLMEARRRARAAELLTCLS
ncbi:MAG: hypothetical protein Q4F38_08445, partial [Akkermansia sp.]|nr:hypothetical protein [Akkermansia sp.]